MPDGRDHVKDTLRSARGDDKNETEAAKRRQEMEARLRKAEPMKDDEIFWNKGNDELLALLGKAEQVKLFRLNPKKLDDGRKGFHGYEVLASVPVPQARRKELVESLGKEFHWYEGWRTACFNPRHGLRVTVGKETLDLVICLQFHWMDVYKNDEKESGVILLGGKWEVADKLLERK